MKRITLFSLLIGVVVLTGCSDELLVNNPNAPTPEALTSEEGINRQARGIYSGLYDGGFFPWIVMQYHDGMGDQIPSAVGNYWFVDMVNPEEITYSDGTTHEPPVARGGPPQQQIVDMVNDRTQSDPALLYEWRAAYKANNEANLLLQALDSPDLTILANADQKMRGFRAWAYFWKGYAYSRIGLLYEQGLVTDEYGETTSEYSSSSQMLAESNRMLDLAIENANGFDAVRESVVPDLFGVKPTGDGLRQAANTLKARNTLQGKYRDEMTQSDWQQVETFADAGLTSNTEAIQWVFDNVTFAATGTVLYRAGALGPTWAYVSMRQVQEYYPGDNRIQREGEDHPGAAVRIVDVENAYTSPRGFNHTTTARGQEPVFESVVGNSQLYLVSAEENLLMAAEAKLALGNAGEAAELVNTVRDMQGAGLDALTAGDIEFETIRRERRVALLARGLAYYDARRLRISTPDGGRENAWVYRSDNETLDTDASIYYNFRPYWPVPVHETTFNPPLDAGAPN